MLYRSSTLYLSLTIVALTHKWLDTPIMPLAWTAVTATCVNKILKNIVFAQICAKKKLSKPLITMPSEITVPNISRGHRWAFFVTFHEVGVVVRGMHFLKHLYQLWSKALKPTFVICLLVLISSKWTKKVVWSVNYHQQVGFIQVTWT